MRVRTKEGMDGKEGCQNGETGAEFRKKGRRLETNSRGGEGNLKGKRMRQEEKRRESRYVLRNAGDHNLLLAWFARVQKSLPGHEPLLTILYHSNL